ncbi:MAG: tRNA (adenosine(37)-N6)-dimethylallyltransferase MiaA [Pseudomonadota bacterium]
MKKSEIKEKIVIILGPTASGKTDLALKLAQKYNGEIINADSMQVYRHLNIGTAKPSEEELQAIKHHLINILNPDEVFTAQNFADYADKAITEIISKGKRPFIVGGTAFYIKALLFGLCKIDFDEDKLKPFRQKLNKMRVRFPNSFFKKWAKRIDNKLASKIEENDFYRLSRIIEIFYLTKKPLSYFHEDHKFAEARYNFLKIGLCLPRNLLYRRINQRVSQMIEDGMVEEVSSTLELGYSGKIRSLNTLGYKWIMKYLEDELSLEKAIELTRRDTRHFAKRQMTWFKKEKDIIWFDPYDEQELLEEKINLFL